MGLSQYLIPPAKQPSKSVLGWLREALTEAELGVESCYGYDLLDEDLRIFRQHFADLWTGLNPAPAPTGGVLGGVNRTTGLHVPQTKRMLSEMIAILGNIEPSWTHTPSNEELRDISDQLDRCTLVWWERTHAVERIIEAIQWSVVNRTGYIFPTWNPHFHGINQGDIELRVGGPKSFFPLWAPKSHDIQLAYAGTIVNDMPVTEFAATWPTLINQVKVDDDATANLAQQAGRTMGNVLLGAAALFDSGIDPANARKQYRGTTPAVRVFYTYLRDMTMNLTRDTVPMGTPGTYWNYSVPAVNSDIPTGLINPSTGQDLTRKARQEDCYLYPWLRLVIWTKDVICYDGPSHAFHGKIPAVKLTLDPWPWDYLGGSMLRDIASQAEAYNRLIRSVDKREQKKADPPKQVNMDMVSTTEAEDLRRQINTPGELIKVENFNSGDVVRPLDDPRNNEISQWEIEYGAKLEQGMMDSLGLNNLQRLAESRQIPSGDTSEKLLQITGARTQRKGNLMEKFVCELAPMVDGLILEWYTARFRWPLFGYKGQTVYDYDYDPNSMVPVNLPGKPNSNGNVFGDQRSGRFDSRIKRARYLMTTMGVQIERGSLLDVTSMTRQLLELKLYSDPNFPKDPISLGESLRLSNMGMLDDGEDKDSRIGRAKKWARIQTETIAALQAMAQQIMAGADPQAQMAQMLQALGAGAGNGGGAHVATGNPEGRPATYQSSPQLETRDGGTRPIINTSN